MALHELRALLRSASRKRDIPSTKLQQVLGRTTRPEFVVATEIVSVQIVDHRTPDDEMGSRLGQSLESICGGGVVAVSEQNQSVSTIAQLVIGMPVLALLLERNEHIKSAPGRSPRDVPEHVQKKRVDLCVARILLEQKQRERSAAARSESGRRAVYSITHLFGDLLNAQPRLGAHERAVTQGS